MKQKVFPPCQNPGNPYGRGSFGLLLVFLVMSLIAISACEKIQNLKSNHFNDALALVQNEEWNKAISSLSEAIRKNPKDHEAWYFRGLCWSKKGNYQNALDDYYQALDLNPEYSYGYNALAWLLATCPDPDFRDGPKALDLAWEAVDIKADAYNYDTLAAAQAQMGQFEEAIRNQERAINLITRDPLVPESLKSAYQDRIRLYRNGEPFLELH